MKANEILALRRRMGLSQEKFARRVGVAFMSVHRWETRKTVPSNLAMERLDQIARSVDLDAKT